MTKLPKKVKNKFDKLLNLNKTQYYEDEFVFLDKELEEKYKNKPEELELIKRQYRARVEREYSIYVIYHPDCGCPVDQFVLLDRFPMSEKIMGSCPNCKKGCLMEISNPIIFYCPLQQKDISLKELAKEMVITKSWQAQFLLAYQLSYLFHEENKEEKR